MPSTQLHGRRNGSLNGNVNVADEEVDDNIEYETEQWKAPDGG